MRPEDPQSFDRLAEDYDFLASLHPRAPIFLEHLPERRERALDLGCGCGHLARPLADHFTQVVGVDLSAPMLALARARRGAPNLRYVRADVEALPLDGGFDLIASHTTFHHLRDVPALVARLRGMLRRGGRLAIVDNVHPKPHVAPYILWGAPALDLLPDVFRHGPRAALRRLRICWGRDWRGHIASDRFLSEAGFRALYGAALPGASFRRLGVFMSVVWTRE